MFKIVKVKTHVKLAELSFIKKYMQFQKDFQLNEKGWVDFKEDIKRKLI